MLGNRKILIAASVLLLLNVAWYIYKHWGLITVDVQGKPLAEVIRSIEKQGNVSIKTDVPLSTPVTMKVKKVLLNEALESLSVAVEGRWRLAYVFGKDKGSISGALGTFSAGERPEGWKSLYYPSGFGMDYETGILDPRKDPWTVNEPAEKTLQSYLHDAARSVAASFIHPDGWNPPIKDKVPSGAIGKVAPKLAKMAQGQVMEVFLLQRGERYSDGGGESREESNESAPEFAGNQGPRPPRRGNRGGFQPGARISEESIHQRVMSEIAKLSKERQAQAKAEYLERKSFFQSLRDLPEDQRRQKMEDFFNMDSVQAKMEQNQIGREARMSVEQRVQRADKYLDRKSTFKQKATAGQ